MFDVVIVHIGYVGGPQVGVLHDEFQRAVVYEQVVYPGEQRHHDADGERLAQGGQEAVEAAPRLRRRVGRVAGVRRRAARRPLHGGV